MKWAFQPFVIVEAGDTLTSIAARVLGHGDRYPDIFALNRDILHSPDRIYPGQWLRLPDDALHIGRTPGQQFAR